MFKHKRVLAVCTTAVITAVTLETMPDSKAEMNAKAASDAVSISAFERIEAEKYSSMSGIEIVGSEENPSIGYVENGDYLVFLNVDFGDGAKSVTLNAATPVGAAIELYLDSMTDTPVAICRLSSTGGFPDYQLFSTDVTDASGTHDLYVKFTGGEGYLLDLDSFQFYTKSTAALEGLGDINGDGRIDARDMTLAKRITLKQLKFNASADVDKSGKVDRTDIQWYQDYLTGKTMEFPKEMTLDDVVARCAVYSTRSPLISPQIARMMRISDLPFRRGTAQPNFMCTHKPCSLVAMMSSTMRSCHSCAVRPDWLYCSTASVPRESVYGSTLETVGVCLPKRISLMQSLLPRLFSSQMSMVNCGWTQARCRTKTPAFRQ